MCSQKDKSNDKMSYGLWLLYKVGWKQYFFKYVKNTSICCKRSGPVVH